MIRALLAAGAAMLLSGCIAFLSESAIVQGPIGWPDGDYRLVVDQVRGAPRLHGAHAGFFIGRTYYRHAIWLPHAPANRSTYPAAELKVDEPVSDIRLKRVSAVGGTVTVDQQARKVIVDLQLADGPYSGNGEYPLKGP